MTNTTTTTTKPKTKFRVRAEHLAARAADAGITLADLITTTEDATRVERMLERGRQVKADDDFQQLSKRDPRAAAKARER